MKPYLQQLKYVIEKLFFKQRNIYTILQPLSNLNLIHRKSNHKLKTIQNSDEFHHLIKEYKLNGYSHKTVINRLNTGAYTLFLVVSEESKEVCGWYWSFFSSKTSIKDALLLEKGDVLLCNAYVHKMYRGQGIYKILIEYASNKSFENNSVKRVVTIVEKSNIASNNSNTAILRRPRFMNELIKFMSFNILSVIRKKDYMLVYFVPFRLKLYESKSNSV